MSWPQPKKGGLHFILNDNENYYFDAKVGCCEFIGFINDVINYGCLECVFCSRIKEKDKDRQILYQLLIIFL